MKGVMMSSFRFGLYLLLLMAYLSACATSPTIQQEPIETVEQVEEPEEPEGDLAEKEFTFDQVLTLVQEIAATESENKDALASIIRQALALYDEGDEAGCVELLLAHTDSPGGYLAHYNLGVLFERQAQYHRALYRYSHALRLNPDFSPALLNLIRLFIRHQRLDDAATIVQHLIAVQPENLEHQAIRLEVLLRQGVYEDVIRASRDILRKDERHVDAMVYMAQANIALERYELARAILTSALRLNDSRADIFYYFGVVELKADNPPGAIANFREAVRLQPDYAEARNNLGVLYHEANDSRAAVEQFTAAVSIYPDFIEAHLNLGNAYKAISQFKEAEQSFLRAIEIDNDYVDAYFNLGILYLESEVPGIDPIERLQKSIAAFNQYMQAGRGQLSADDPAERYIQEANQAIELTKQRLEMMRQAQMQAEQYQAEPEPEPDPEVDESNGEDQLQDDVESSNNSSDEQNTANEDETQDEWFEPEAEQSEEDEWFEP